MAVVLVIDDELDIATLLSDALTDEGYEVFLAANGREGRQAFDQYCPDLVICDYMMPGLDGIGLLKALRADLKFPHVPFIMMSAMPPPRIHKAARYSAFVQKPFRLSEVVRLVSDLLRRNN